MDENETRMQLINEVGDTTTRKKIGKQAFAFQEVAFQRSARLRCLQRWQRPTEIPGEVDHHRVTGHRDADGAVHRPAGVDPVGPARHRGQGVEQQRREPGRIAGPGLGRHRL